MQVILLFIKDKKKKKKYTPEYKLKKP